MKASFLTVRRAALWCLLLAIPACTDPYMPDVITSPPNYLVVDGFLNAQGVTTIKLSRTYAVGSKASPPVETKAVVYLEEEAGPRYSLREAPAGTYTSPALVLNTAKKYRLRISTLPKKEYASNFVPVKTTPPIDNVSWRTDGNELNIYVNSHDASSTTQYYRWEYAETWEINPVYAPQVEYVNSRMRDIVVPYPTICWGNAPSTKVLIDKTTNLSQDVVSDFRVQQLTSGSALLNSRYSILVQQQALTKEEYAYWELLRKNTESIGSLFDPQPVQLTGNVHCLDTPADIALGFVGAHSLTEKRIFIGRQELPRAWRVPTGYESCLPPDTVYIDRPPPVRYPALILESNFGSGSGFLPIQTLYNLAGGISGYTAKSRDCIDCRTRGTSVRPTFW